MWIDICQSGLKARFGLFKVCKSRCVKTFFAFKTTHMFNSLLCHVLVVRNWEQTFVTSLTGRREQEISDCQSICFSFSDQFFKFVFLVVNQDSMTFLILNLIPFFKWTIFSKSRGASFVVITLSCSRPGTFRVIISKIVLLFGRILAFIFPLLFNVFNSVLFCGVREEHSFEDVNHREIKGTSLILKDKF